MPSNTTDRPVVANPRGRPHGRAIPFLRDWRAAKLVTATELAEQVGLSRTGISRIESGGNASYKTIKRIAEALGITTDELLTRKPKSARGK